MNNDGNLDLAITSGTSTAVYVYLGNGDGTFGVGQFFSTGSNPAGVAIADLNEDGRPDIVTCNLSDNTLTTLAGDGTGMFAAPVAYSTGVSTTPTGLSVADLNGDGHLDLATTLLAKAQVGVFYGTGSGFGALNTYLGTASMKSLNVTDMNSDGKPDLVSEGTSSISVILGK